MHLAMVIVHVLLVVAVRAYSAHGFNRVPSGVPGRVWAPAGHYWTRFRRMICPVTAIPDAADGDVPQRVQSPTIQELFGTRQVSLLGTSDMESIDDVSPLIFRETPAAAGADGSSIVELALMPFPTPLFPGSREFLYIYEMRFRTLMNDAEQQQGGSLGRCFISDEGAVGKIGTRCTIVEQRRLQDGKGFFVIESVERFKILRVTQCTPYLLAEVVFIDDDMPETQEDVRVNQVLCEEVYALLKTYLRLARFRLGTGLGSDSLELDVDNIEVLVERNDANYGDEAGTNTATAALGGGTDTAILTDGLPKEAGFEGRAGLGTDVGARTTVGYVGSSAAGSTGSGVDDAMAGAEDGDGGGDDDEEDADEDEDWDEDEDVEYSESDREMGLSPAVRDSRPLGPMGRLSGVGDSRSDSNSESDRGKERDGGTDRHRRFSFAVAHLLSTDATIMQILLQERCTAFRLHGLKRILIEAVAELGTVLVENGVITQAIFDDIRERGERDDEDDSDLMPDEDFTGMTLQSELSEVLVRQLGLSPGVVAAKVNMDVLVSGFADPPDAAAGGVGGVGGAAGTAPAAATGGAGTDAISDANADDDDDLWNGNGAFQ